ncbi:MAG: hypothetical protein Q3972_04920 [Corynebacterium sp.]|nr:hypothetical protein [Corynebacterium sp.]
MFASFKTTIAKFALSTAAAAGILGGATAFASTAQAEAFYSYDYYTPTSGVADTNFFDDPFINDARYHADRQVYRLEHLSDADKAYYVAAIEISTSYAQINNFLHEAYSENYFNAR